MKFALHIFILLVLPWSLEAQVNWVGSMTPTSGAFAQGGSLTVTTQVLKTGITDAPGQGAGITCQITYGTVSFFGGTWSNSGTFPMTYMTDAIDKDVYSGTLSPTTAGLYEYICRCTDNIANAGSWVYHTAYNGQLTVSAPLPVELITFNAFDKGAEVELEWETVSERNNKSFVIERAGNDLQWETIGQMAGSGTTDEMQQYIFTDEKPLAGESYYRLRNVDMDGREEVSDAVSISRYKSAGVSVFPNPAIDYLQVSTSQESRLLIYNALGALVLDQNVNGGSMISVADLQPGYYHTVVRDLNGSVTYTDKLVKI